MSCLVNFYVITPKEEWQDIVISWDQKDINLIMKQVPEKYQPMLKALFDEFKSLNTIMDNRNPEIAKKVYAVAIRHHAENIRFDTRYHEESLFQILRNTFYNTLLAIRNDFNWDKYNYCCVVSSDEVIEEELSFERQEV